MTAPLSRREQNRQSRERRILDAALRVFSSMGYSGTTMDAVAAEAGLSKPTLYQYFPSKEQLFQEMMLAQRDQMLDMFQHPSPDGMVHELLAFAWAYAGVVMRPDMLSLARLIIGEVSRFPEIGRAYQASGPDKLLRGIIDYLVAQRAAGRLTFDDGELAAQDLWGLILSAPRTQALYLPDDQPTQAQLGRYISNGLSVFLRAYSTDPATDLNRLKALERARATTGNRE
ncbi:TetR/AcrR family transcriptional regulator [Neotabrizicola shimadae]|uniref:TetR/AcrR family transcriptional regulator n=1 Tax=Neotabrizicola shimadae TaxID=2807096 RepID=A0A8G1EC58_9RHOB|nr:TetR/AcrR family transcriptional regulator [Neotabrizicola shimadae]QYZ70315.1 TetR/AcrR family transcriptional regulator [Neotabrizicola shimadae]